MNEDYYKKHEPMFGTWHIVKKLGQGSFGAVFEIERDGFGANAQKQKAAMKAITIPQSSNEVDQIRDEMPDEKSVTAYFHGVVEELTAEFDIMNELKGESTIVSYEDHDIIAHDNGIGWDIFIRMELLTPLTQFMREATITKRLIIQLGMDICEALALCQQHDIIHRDVKPENIFFSANKRFKLGDFGIAKVVSNKTGSLSQKGTYTYMAPEVYRGSVYNATVDIYSLGIVLYQYLNGNRTPFLPAYPNQITHMDRENALQQRMSGAPIPAPINGDGALTRVVLKACSYEPGSRYQTAGEMRRDLQRILETESDLDEVLVVLPRVTSGIGEKTARGVGNAVFQEAEATSRNSTGRSFADPDETVSLLNSAPVIPDESDSFDDFGDATIGNFHGKTPLQKKETVVAEKQKAAAVLQPEPSPKAEQPEQRSEPKKKFLNKRFLIIVASVAASLLIAALVVGLILAQKPAKSDLAPKNEEPAIEEEQQDDSLVFVDVPKDAWFYDSVTELVKIGAIKGNDDGTFAPNGALTNGQALKLIAFAVDVGDQPPLEGKHWASGFLEYAKDRGWLKDDIDLNAPINRLQFCTIAAKAKNIVAQPEAPLFQDCEDKYVLALCQAGVIDGFAENLFCPEMPLTRAQACSAILKLKELSFMDGSYAIIQDNGVEAAVRACLDLGNTDLIPTERLGEIDVLDISKNRGVTVSHIADLELLPNLQTLILTGQHPSDFDILQRLDNLRELHLNDCGTGDAEFLNDLPLSLEFLDIRKNGIVSLVFLGRLKNLTYLNISDNDIQDLTPLGQLTALTNLDAVNIKATDWTPAMHIPTVNPKIKDITTSSETGKNEQSKAGKKSGQVVTTTSSSGKKMSPKSNDTEQSKDEKKPGQTAVASQSSEASVSQQPKTVPVSSVSLPVSLINLEIGGSYNLFATVSPSNATEKSISWSTGNSSIATVQNGCVVAKGIGSTTVTAMCGGKAASCTVVVN